MSASSSSSSSSSYHHHDTHLMNDDEDKVCMHPSTYLPTHLVRDVGLAPDVEPADDEVRVEDRHRCIQAVLGELVAVDEFGSGLGFRDGH